MRLSELAYRARNHDSGFLILSRKGSKYRKIGSWNKPAIRQVRPHVLEKGVAHVIDAEDIDVRVLWDCFADVRVQPQTELFPFFGGFGEVDDFCAL